MQPKIKQQTVVWPPWWLQHVAARDGHLDIVRLLVELGADSDAAVKLALQLGHVEVDGLMAERHG